MTPPDPLAAFAALGEQVPDRLSRREAMLGWMEVAPYGILTTDADFKIRTWNRWLVSHSGLGEDEVVGRSLFELFPTVVERRLDDPFRRALNGEIAVLSTALHKYLLPFAPATDEFDTQFMLQTVRIAPLPSGADIGGTITIIEDVTQRECQARILRRQQEHDRLLSSALTLLLETERPLQLATDLFPRIAAPLKLEAYFNFLIDPGSNVMRLYASGGISPEVRKALAVADVDGPGPCSMCARTQSPVIFNHIQSNDTPGAELIRKLGLRSYAGFPLLVGERLLGTLSFGSYARDVIESDEIVLLSTIAQYLATSLDRALRENALREAQEKLAQHAEVLETKIAERTVKLHETIQQLESFSYTIAHDLRAPIRSLKGYSEVLLSDFSDAIPLEGRSMLQRLHRASNRLDALTRDLLKFSKIAREDVQLAPVDLAELIDDIVLLTPALQNGVVQLRPPLGIVRAQHTLLQQCVSNLFDNAIKFTAPGVKPVIVVRTEIVQGDSSLRSASGYAFNSATRPSVPMNDPLPSGPRLRLWIEDNGIGIPPAAHEKIFGIFERVSGLDNVEGTGIGLAIVARAMQQMGGRCGVESSLGHGSRFWLELAAV